MSKATELRSELESKIVQQMSMVTWNDFGNIVEAVLDKETADEYRKAAIKEGKWIKMDGEIHNG